MQGLGRRGGRARGALQDGAHRSPARRSLGASAVRPRLPGPALGPPLPLSQRRCRKSPQSPRPSAAPRLPGSPSRLGTVERGSLISSQGLCRRVRGGARGAVELGYCPPCFGQVLGSLASFFGVFRGSLRRIEDHLPPTPHTLTLLVSWLLWGTLACPRRPCRSAPPLYPSLPGLGQSRGPSSGCTGKGSAVGIFLQQPLSSTPSPMSYCILLPHPASDCHQLQKPGLPGFLGHPGLPPVLYSDATVSLPIGCSGVVLGAPGTFLGRLGFCISEYITFRISPPPPLTPPYAELVPVLSPFPPPPYHHHQHPELFVSVGLRGLPSSTGLDPSSLVLS